MIVEILIIPPNVNKLRVKCLSQDKWCLIIDYLTKIKVRRFMTIFVAVVRLSFVNVGLLWEASV